MSAETQQQQQQSSQSSQSNQSSQIEAMFDRALETLDTFEATIAKLLVAARGIHKNSTDSSLTAAADKPDGLDVVASAVKARQDYNDSLARLSSILIEIETIKTNTESTTTENQTLSDDEVAKLESKRTELLSQISEIKQQKRTISKHVSRAQMSAVMFLDADS